MLQYFCYYIGLAHTTGVKASVLVGMNVFTAILISSLLLRLEKLTVRSIIGCTVGFLGIILIKETVITVCNAQTPVTTAFLDQIRRVCPPSDRYRFAFRLLWHGGVLFLRYLHDIHLRTNALEEELHRSISNEVLLKLLMIFDHSFRTSGG